MAVKYTTATNVRNLLGQRVKSDISDAMINVWIEEAEGMIDIWLRIGTSGNSLTFSSAKKPHLVLEMAATMIAGSLCLASSSLSWLSMDQALLMQETMIYWAEEAKRIITEASEDHGGFIVEQ
jgi:hypothetical protein